MPKRHSPVTLAGTPDYITISGQTITRNSIDLAADVTGTLPVANGGTGVTTSTGTGAVVLGTSPTIATPTLTLANSSPTAAGGIGYDQTNNEVQIGDGTNSQIIKMAAWTAYTPSLTNITLGDGTLAFAYAQVGKLVCVRARFVFRTTTSISGVMTFSLPVTAVTAQQETQPCTILDQGTATFMGAVRLISTTTIEIVALGASGTYTTQINTSSTVPMTWANTDTLGFYFFYEAA